MKRATFSKSSEITTVPSAKYTSRERMVARPITTAQAAAIRAAIHSPIHEVIPAWLNNSAVA